MVQYDNHLFVLTGNQLFSLRMDGTELTLVGSVPATVVHTDHTEMLATDGAVVLAGYSYSHSATELMLFDVDDRFGLRHRSTHHLTGSRPPHFSAVAQNHGRIAFYEDRTAYPELQKWIAESPGSPPVPTHHSDRTYAMIPPSPCDVGRKFHGVYHTSTTCDLSLPDLACQSTVLVGPEAHTYFLTSDSAYIWTTFPRGLLHRLPLDGSAPTVLAVTGAPPNWGQTFFEQNGDLYVVRDTPPALLRVSRTDFGSTLQEASPDAYAPLLPGEGDFATTAFVNGYLLYAMSGQEELLRGRPLAPAQPPFELLLSHPIVDIVPAGASAVIHGFRRNEGETPFQMTPISLASAPAALQGTTYARYGLLFGTRTELVAIAEEPRGEPRLLIRFLAWHDGTTRDVGQLSALRHDDSRRDDVLVLLVGTRLFVLADDELVEASWDGSSVRERQRLHLQ
jgi:hypothetical protein